MKKQPIVTPCISVCTVEEETGLCRGCFRSVEEIRQWLRYSPEKRLAIMAELPTRKTPLP